MMFVTRNYDLFEPSKINRDVDKLSKIYVSMKEHGYIPAYPLHCCKGETDKIIVKAGHHRLESAKLLKLPVYYVVCDDNASIAQLEKATTPWSLEDFVKSHYRAESADYGSILAWRDRTGLPIGMVASMLSGDLASSCTVIDHIKSGTFVVRDERQIAVVAYCSDAVYQLGFNWAKSYHFISALSLCACVADFDYQEWPSRVKTNKKFLDECRSRDEYLDMIELVYNKRSKVPIPLSFAAKQVFRQVAAMKANRKTVSIRFE